MERIAAGCAAKDSERGLDALLLGVTPRIAQMRWPAASKLVAIDSSLPMVRGVWPGDVSGVQYAVCANWLQMPVADRSFDLVIGDGSSICVSHSDGLPRLLESVSKALRDDGVFLLRCYFQAPEREAPDTLWQAALSSRVGSFHELKLRLLMSLQASPEDGVLVSDLHRWWTAHHCATASLPTGPGWEPEAVSAIDLYRTSDTRYFFPTIEKFRDLMAPCMQEICVSKGASQIGERCPILVMRPRRDPPSFSA